MNGGLSPPRRSRSCKTELISAIGVLKTRAAALIWPDCCLKEMAEQGTVLSGTVWQTPGAPPLLTHTRKDTHTTSRPPTRIFSLHIPQPAHLNSCHLNISLVSNQPWNNESIDISSVTHAGFKHLATKMAPRDFNTQARLLEPRCTLLLGRNQIVFVSDGKGDTNIWTLGSGVWQWSLSSQHVNDRLCVLCPRALSHQCRAAAQPAACSPSSWNKYRGGPLRAACYTQDREDLCVSEVEWYHGYW